MGHDVNLTPVDEDASGEGDLGDLRPLKRRRRPIIEKSPTPFGVNGKKAKEEGNEFNTESHDDEDSDKDDDGETPAYAQPIYRCDKAPL